MSTIQLSIALVAATLVGLAAQRLRVPGGLILGAMVGAAIVVLVTNAEVTLPPPLQDAALIAIGSAIGLQLSRSTVKALGPVVVPAVASAILIIVAGVAITYLLRATGVAPPGDLLATSPGALSVMTAMAVEQDTGAVQVAVFHLVRVIMVILSLPLLLRHLP